MGGWREENVKVVVGLAFGVERVVAKVLCVRVRDGVNCVRRVYLAAVGNLEAA